MTIEDWNAYDWYDFWWGYMSSFPMDQGHIDIIEYFGMVANGIIKTDALSAEEANTYAGLTGSALITDADFSEIQYFPDSFSVGGYYNCKFGAGVPKLSSPVPFNIEACEMPWETFVAMAPVIDSQYSFIGGEFKPNKIIGTVTADDIVTSGISGMDLCKATIANPVIFTGTEDTSSFNATNTDMSTWQGLTGEQIISMTSLSGATLPTTQFTGSESFSGVDLTSVDLSNCTGITGEQIVQASNLTGAKISATFTGSEVLSNNSLKGADFTGTVGLTTEQVLSVGKASMAGLQKTKLPAMTFDGNEDFTGVYLWKTDLTNCSGITGQQIAATSYFSDVYCTQQQYDYWKSDLLNSNKKGKYLYVDGVKTRIE